jgi:hypothetical protein
VKAELPAADLKVAARSINRHVAYL